jgi:hypothetical protein
MEGGLHTPRCPSPAEIPAFAGMTGLARLLLKPLALSLSKGGLQRADVSEGSPPHVVPAEAGTSGGEELRLSWRASCTGGGAVHPLRSRPSPG